METVEGGLEEVWIYPKFGKEFREMADDYFDVTFETEEEYKSASGQKYVQYCQEIATYFDVLLEDEVRECGLFPLEMMVEVVRFKSYLKRLKEMKCYKFLPDPIKNALEMDQPNPTIEELQKEIILLNLKKANYT